MAPIKRRPGLLLVAMAFTGYHAARSLMWTHPIAHPWLLVVSILSIAGVTLMCLFWRGPGEEPAAPSRQGVPTRVPAWLGALAVVVTAIVPHTVATAIGESIKTPFATGYIGGVGAMLTMVMIRRRPVYAWGGIVVLAVGAMWELGVLEALSFGVIGAAMWVGVAQVIVALLDRAAADTQRLMELQQAAAVWQVAHSVRRRERRVRVQFALQVAGPLLTRVIESDGRLDVEDRAEARIVEGTLRDELRGSTLLDSRVRVAIEGVRRRGSSVMIFDDGALDDLDESQLNRIRGELADVIRDATAPRIIIRSSRHEDAAVTVVGRSTLVEDAQDDDDVELWREIARSGPLDVIDD